MPLLNRDTVIDRPVLVNRGEQESEEDESRVTKVETLGDGGGPIINGVEFRPGDFDIVASSNLAAVLATGEADGDAFVDSFRNSAFQLYELKESGEEISDLTRFSVERDVSNIGINERELEILRGEVEEEADEEGEERQEENEEDGEEIIEEVEEIEEELDELEDDIKDELEEEEDEEETA